MTAGDRRKRKKRSDPSQELAGTLSDVHGKNVCIERNDSTFQNTSIIIYSELPDKLVFHIVFVEFVPGHIRLLTLAQQSLAHVQEYTNTVYDIYVHGCD